MSGMPASSKVQAIHNQAIEKLGVYPVRVQNAGIRMDQNDLSKMRKDKEDFSLRSSQITSPWSQSVWILPHLFQSVRPDDSRHLRRRLCSWRHSRRWFAQCLACTTWRYLRRQAFRNTQGVCGEVSGDVWLAQTRTGLVYQSDFSEESKPIDWHAGVRSNRMGCRRNRPRMVRTVGAIQETSGIRTHLGIRENIQTWSCGRND